MQLMLYNWRLSLKGLFKSAVIIFHIYVFHFTAAGMIKSAVHHFWNLGRKWLNMRSTDTCTCIHQHYFSRVIVDILFCLFEGGWSQLTNISIKWPPSAALLSEPIRYLLWRLHSWTALLRTAQRLRPVKETEQLEGSGEGFLLAHTSNNMSTESMVSPVQQL